MGMARNPKIALLAGVPLFAQCSKRDLEEIAAIADEIDFPAGRTLTREGQNGREFVVLADGIVDVERDGERVNTLGPGDFFGEISLVTGRPRTATVTTRSPARAFVLSAPAFRSLIQRAPRVRTSVLAAAALRLSE
jgi:CRP/FNR family transcriptional regulator, cyclic AMP receptor protein